MIAFISGQNFLQIFHFYLLIFYGIFWNSHNSYTFWVWAKFLCLIESLIVLYLSWKIFEIPNILKFFMIFLRFWNFRKNWNFGKNWAFRIILRRRPEKRRPDSDSLGPVTLCQRWDIFQKIFLNFKKFQQMEKLEWKNWES